MKVSDRDGKQILEGDILYYYEEDGEDEAGAGVGNASFYVNQGYLKVEKHHGRLYLRHCDKEGNIITKRQIKDLNSDDLLSNYKTVYGGNISIIKRG